MQEIQERAVNARQAMAVPNFQASKLPSFQWGVLRALARP